MAFITGTKSTKGINLNALPKEAWINLFGEVGGGPSSKNGDGAYTFGVKAKRAAMVAAVPFSFFTLEGDEEIPEKDLPFKINPLYGGMSALLWQITFALHGGAAYWATAFKGNNPSRIRWFTPGSVKPDYDKNTHSLKSFKRGNNIEWAYDDEMVRAVSKEWGHLGWIWALGIQEIGPGIALDTVVSLPSDVLASSNQLMSNLLSNGAVLPHFVTAEDNPGEPEKERIRDKLFRTLFKGVDSPSALEVFQQGLSIERIGTAPKDLEMSIINEGNETEVSVGMDTPRPMVTGEAANRSILDRLTQMWILYTIVPIAERIVYAMNHHTLEPIGYRMEINPEELTSLQEEEHLRAQSVLTLVNSGETLENAYRLLGYDLPDGYVAPEATPPPEGDVTPEPTDPETAESEGDSEAKNAELAQFRRWIKKRPYADVKSFTAHYISDEDKQIIVSEYQNGDALKVAKDTRIKQTKELADDYANEIAGLVDQALDNDIDRPQLRAALRNVALKSHTAIFKLNANIPDDSTLTQAEDKAVKRILEVEYEAIDRMVRELYSAIQTDQAQPAT